MDIQPTTNNEDANMDKSAEKVDTEEKELTANDDEKIEDSSTITPMADTLDEQKPENVEEEENKQNPPKINVAINNEKNDEKQTEEVDDEENEQQKSREDSVVCHEEKKEIEKNEQDDDDDDDDDDEEDNEEDEQDKQGDQTVAENAEQLSATKEDEQVNEASVSALLLLKQSAYTYSTCLQHGAGFLQWKKGVTVPLRKPHEGDTAQVGLYGQSCANIRIKFLIEERLKDRIYMGMELVTKDGKCSIVSGDMNISGFGLEYAVLAFFFADDEAGIYAIIINTKFILPDVNGNAKSISQFFAIGEVLTVCDCILYIAPLNSIFDLSSHERCYTQPSSKQRQSQSFVKIKSKVRIMQVLERLLADAFPFGSNGQCTFAQVKSKITGKIFNERLAIGEDDDITTSSSVKHQEAKEDPRKANELPPAKHKRLVKENPVFLEEEAEEEENRGKANKTPAKKKSTPQQMQCKSKEKNQVAQDDGLVAALIKENKENKEKLKLLSVMQKANEKLKKENEVKKEQERNLKKQNADLLIEAKNLSKQLADNKKTKEGLITSNPPLPPRVHNKKNGAHDGIPTPLNVDVQKETSSAPNPVQQHVAPSTLAPGEVVISKALLDLISSALYTKNEATNQSVSQDKPKRKVDNKRQYSHTNTIAHEHDDLNASLDENSPDRHDNRRKSITSVGKDRTNGDEFRHNSRSVGKDRNVKHEEDTAKKRNDSNTQHTHRHTQPALHTNKQEDELYSSGPDDRSDRDDGISRRDMLEVHRHPQDKKGSRGEDCRPSLKYHGTLSTKRIRDDCHRDRRESKSHREYRDRENHRKDNDHHDSHNGEDYYTSDHHRRSCHRQKRDDYDSNSDGRGEYHYDASDQHRRSNQKQKRDYDDSSPRKGHRRSHHKQNRDDYDSSSDGGDQYHYDASDQHHRSNQKNNRDYDDSSPRKGHRRSHHKHKRDDDSFSK